MSDVAAWSREDVCSFLERLGLPEELQLAFRRNAVDGCALTLSQGNMDREGPSGKGASSPQCTRALTPLPALALAPSLPALVAADLVGLTDADLVNELGCTHLQVAP